MGRAAGAAAAPPRGPAAAEEEEEEEEGCARKQRETVARVELILKLVGHVDGKKEKNKETCLANREKGGAPPPTIRIVYCKKEIQENNELSLKKKAGTAPNYV